MAKIKNKKIVTTSNTDKNVEKLDQSYIASGNLKWYSSSKKQFGPFLETYINTTIYLRNWTLGLFPIEIKTYVYSKTCTFVYSSLFSIAKKLR